eukprot:4694055-Alexandrium_andersonii.AAC.1
MAIRANCNKAAPDSPALHRRNHTGVSLAPWLAEVAVEVASRNGATGPLRDVAEARDEGSVSVHRE